MLVYMCFALLYTINNMAPFKVVHVYQYNKFTTSQIHSVDHTFQSIIDKMKVTFILIAQNFYNNVLVKAMIVLASTCVQSELSSL